LRVSLRVSILTGLVGKCATGSAWLVTWGYLYGFLGEMVRWDVSGLVSVAARGVSIDDGVTLNGWAE
jgi:hypothetical protein